MRLVGIKPDSGECRGEIGDKPQHVPEDLGQAILARIPHLAWNEPSDTRKERSVGHAYRAGRRSVVVGRILLLRLGFVVTLGLKALASAEVADDLAAAVLSLDEDRAILRSPSLCRFCGAMDQSSLNSANARANEVLCIP